MVGPGWLDFTNGLFQIKHHQQATKSYILRRCHSYLDDFGVTELSAHLAKEIVIQRRVICR